MPSWFTRLTDIVWTSVFAVGFSLASLVTGIVSANLPLVTAFGVVSLTLAILSIRD